MLLRLLPTSTMFSCLFLFNKIYLYVIMATEDKTLFNDLIIVFRS